MSETFLEPHYSHPVIAVKNKPKHAYLILAHDNLLSLNLLIESIISTGTVYLHLDKRSKIKVKELVSGQDIFIFKKYKIYWGDWSIIEATKFLAEEAIKDGHERLTLLSGVSFPMVSKNDLIALGNSQNDYFQADIFDEIKYPSQFKFRFTHVHVNIPLNNNYLGRILRRLAREFSKFLPKIDYREYLKSISLMVGSQWWSVRTSTYMEANQRIFCQSRFNNYFQKIECGDESYFMTGFNAVVEKFTNKSTTYVEWLGRGRPREFSLDEISNIPEAKDFFFIRKVIIRKNESTRN
jgi:Core-2/I-Branching enzyme